MLFPFRARELFTWWEQSIIQVIDEVLIDVVLKILVEILIFVTFHPESVELLAIFEHGFGCRGAGG